MSKDTFVHDAGKGSRQREADKEKWAENWDKIFRKDTSQRVAQHWPKEENKEKNDTSS